MCVCSINSSEALNTNRHIEYAFIVGLVEEMLLGVCISGVGLRRRRRVCVFFKPNEEGGLRALDVLILSHRRPR